MTETNLIKQKFKSAIQRGTGEAHLLMQSNPDIDFSSLIIKACIKNYAYDGQCEASRDTYLFELIKLSGREDKIKEAIFKALLTPQKDTWTLTQLFELTLMFAKQGDFRARKVIYDAFVLNPIWRSDWAGTYQIVDLDGMRGLKFIAEEFGKRMDRDPEDWHDDGLIKYFQDKNPEINVWAELDQEAGHNRFINAYVSNVREIVAQQADRPIKLQPVYNDILAEVLLTTGRFNYWKLRDDEPGLNLIAERLRIEENRDNIGKLLFVFTRYKYPLDSNVILNLARHGANKKIRQQAIKALQFLKGDEIRQFIIDHTKMVKNPQDYVIGLRSNYKPGDHELLTQLVENSNDQSVLELLVINYIDIYRDNSTAECRKPLEAIYNKHNCGLCRKDIVEVLLNNDVLSDKIKDEIRFDCNENTRKLYE